MRRRNAIADAREFSERIWITEECRALAERYPDLAGFWEHCDRADCMMALLHATGYQNSDKMWQVFEIIRGEQKRKKGEADLEQWRANLYQIIREQAEEVETAERERSAVPGYARMAKWAAAHGWTEYYAHDAAQGEKIDAGVRASLDAAFDGKTREECYQAFDLGAQEAYLEALKRQADLLRKILRNPFHRFSDEDFG